MPLGSEDEIVQVIWSIIKKFFFFKQPCILFSFSLYYLPLEEGFVIHWFNKLVLFLNSRTYFHSVLIIFLWFNKLENISLKADLSQTWLKLWSNEKCEKSTTAMIRLKTIITVNEQFIILSSLEINWAAIIKKLILILISFRR